MQSLISVLEQFNAGQDKSWPKGTSVIWRRWNRS